MDDSSTVARLRQAMFARHSNPWSAWTRWASTPLVLVPVWTRSRRDAALVAAWLAVNPVLFPKPANDSAWATRAMLGEEQWILDRPRDATMVLSAVTGAISVGALVAARRHHLRTTVIATGIQMVLVMAYWEQMVRSYDRRSR
ncbi:hypothetical protein CIW52_12780 [Mycolicibacterium sp. P9-64]|uniref:DUF6653 family protein n=1 Tax=Mycolicibacterium sp. P9-64 TaxID=2024612 RepID=UPI0011F0525E|nr:DUF6653 family protein [Mycolicibacterium sp. P9-64]KAA0083299.1 hypothetical protein CIW52_12780 [Mycolicibacterium sp. P9-64]